MSKSLYISAFLPQKDAGHAGGRLAYENLAALRLQGDVDIVVCTTEAVEAYQVPDMYIIQQTHQSLAGYLLSNLGTLSWQTLLTAPWLHTRLNSTAESTIVALLEKNDYDTVFVDFTQCVLGAIRAIARSSRPSKVTAFLHDVFAQRIVRSRRGVDALVTGWICREEQLLLNSLKDVIVPSEKDAELLRSLYSVQAVKVKPFTPPDWVRNVNRTVTGVDPTNLVFFGNFDRSENSSAAAWFVEKAFPDVRAALPATTLTLLGTGSDRLANRLNVRGVVGIGFIEDPSPYFSKCALAIAPLFEGAGVKFKVLEALAGGVPVIGTAVACEGIPHHSILHRAEAAEFAKATIHILRGAQKEFSNSSGENVEKY